MILPDLPIVPLDLRSASQHDYALLAALHARLCAERLPDDPPIPLAESIRTWQTLPPAASVATWLIPSGDGAVALASGSVWLWRTGENQHLAPCEIGVLPEFRRAGLARRLLAQIAGTARREGRRLLQATTNERVPAGGAFLRRLGAREGQRGHLNQLDLADLDRDLLRRWLAEGPTRAAGFDLGRWTGEYPEDELPAIAALHDLLNQAPRDGLDIEDQHVTPEQLREMERANRARGTERWTLYARARADGMLAGFTEVFWYRDRPAILSQA